MYVVLVMDDCFHGHGAKAVESLLLRGVGTVTHVDADKARKRASVRPESQRGSSCSKNSEHDGRMINPNPQGIAFAVMLMKDETGHEKDWETI